MEGNYDAITFLGENWCKYISTNKDEINYYACLLWINLVMLVQQEEGSIEAIMSQEFIGNHRLEYLENIK